MRGHSEELWGRFLAPGWRQCLQSEVHELTNLLSASYRVDVRSLHRGDVPADVRGARAWHAFWARCAGQAAVVSDSKLRGAAAGCLVDISPLLEGTDLVLLCPAESLCLVLSHEYPDFGPFLLSGHAGEDCAE